MSASSTKTLFTWQGKTLKGKAVSGELTAQSIPAAKAYLRTKQIVVLKIKKKAKPFFTLRKNIAAKDVTVFTRQLATMLCSGIPLVQALTVVAKGHSNLQMAKLICDIKDNVEEGHSFSESLKKYPTLFNTLFCNLVDTGEYVGALDRILLRLATYKEKSETLKGKIRKALVYPITILSVAIVITSLILIFVVPQFQSLFKGFGAELPNLTRFVITLSYFMQDYWWLVLSGLFVGGCGFSLAYKKKLNFRHQLEKFSLILPIFGKLLTKAAVARFARTLATTYSAGVPIVESLESVAYATGNIVFETAVLNIHKDLSQGKTLNEAISQTKQFPEAVVQMVAIGEESGELENMLNKIADYYEEDVDNTVNNISILIEPLLMVLLGILIGGLIIAMYLPIFKMGSIV